MSILFNRSFETDRSGGTTEVSIFISFSVKLMLMLVIRSMPRKD
jgi:hypothetical protein